MILSRGKGLSLVTLQVRAEWTQMSCLNDGKGLTMADGGGG